MKIIIPEWNNKIYLQTDMTQTVLRLFVYRWSHAEYRVEVTISIAFTYLRLFGKFDFYTSTTLLIIPSSEALLANNKIYFQIQSNVSSLIIRKVVELKEKIPLSSRKAHFYPDHLVQITEVLSLRFFCQQSCSLGYRVLCIISFITYTYIIRGDMNTLFCSTRLLI